MKKNYKELKQKIYKNSTDEIWNYVNRLFEVNQGSFSDKINREVKKKPKSYLLITTYFLTRLDINYLIDSRERGKIERLIEHSIRSSNKKELDLYSIELSLKSEQIINKYGWTAFHKFMVEPDAKINNSLLLIDYFINSLNSYKYEKFKWVVDKHGLSSSRNFGRYNEPRLDKLFKNETKDLLELLSINFRQIFIEKCQRELYTEKQPEPKNKVFFSEDSQMAFIFKERKNIKILNEYLSFKNASKQTPKPAFFNRLLYILIHSQLNGEKLIHISQPHKQDYKKEIKRIFGIDLKLDTINVSTNLVDKEFEYFKKIFGLKFS